MYLTAVYCYKYSLLYPAKDTEISVSPNIRVKNLDVPVSAVVVISRYLYRYAGYQDTYIDMQDISTK